MDATAEREADEWADPGRTRVGGFRYQGAGLRSWAAEGPGGESQNLRDGQKKKNSNRGDLDSTFKAQGKSFLLMGLV